jgi:hypothetical protein
VGAYGEARQYIVARPESHDHRQVGREESFLYAPDFTLAHPNETLLA